MNRLFNVLTILILIHGCTTTKTDYRCALDPENFPKYGQDSKVIEFKRTAIMDTITAIINGQITALADYEPLVAGNIELTNKFNNYQAISDTSGHFKFYHIAAGTYRLTAAYVGFRQLINDSIHLGSGDITTLKIGMGRKGQDDLKTK